MTLYNSGDHTQSMEILLNIIADTAEDESIQAYKKAIKFYSGRLDEIFLPSGRNLI